MKTSVFWVLLAVAAAALVGITFPLGLTEGQETKEQKANMSVREALEKITLTEEAAKKSRLEPTPGFSRVVFVHKLEESMKRKATEPKVVTRDKDGKTFAVGLQYTCNPIYINTFTDADGKALNARQFSFSVDTISWQAGNGWPVYTDYCPVNGYSTSNYFPDAKSHQIVPIIMGQNYFVGCASSAVCASNGAGQIAFAVNDTGVPGNDYYSDNRGYFTVTVWGIVP
jgi:hypothetical protein